MWSAPLLWLLLGHRLDLHLRERLLLRLLPLFCSAAVRCLLLLMLLLLLCARLHLGQESPLKGCLSLSLAQLRCQLVQLQLLARASTL